MIFAKDNLLHRRRLAIWAFFCAATALILMSYLIAGRAAGQGELLLPLDDVYIHFQYARQIAAGQFYIYNPGLPPSSGATSFLYPYILAVGHLLGFQELNLGLWAMLIGAAALLASAWILFRLGMHFGLTHIQSMIGAALFLSNGVVSWHYMSGMETGLMICFTLLTGYTFASGHLAGFSVSAAALAMIRPEGSLMTMIALALSLFQFRHKRRWLLLPLIGLLIQPVVNGLATGSFIASGGQAKSLMGMVPQDWGLILGRIFGQFIRMWIEFLTGYNPERELWYALPLIGIAALVGLVLLWRRDRRLLVLMLIGWYGVVSAAVATLDTAFWHFKRYQMPLIALLFPLFVLGIVTLLHTRWFHWMTNLSIKFAFALALIFSSWTFIDFLRIYAVNSHYVYQQPYQMARWLAEHTPEDAVVAVHDVGMMRYMGGRTTLDIVGLTTPGAALAWRNGPGSVAELLLREQPDYIASYSRGHGYGLGMLADTQLYGDPLATFPVSLDPRINVALAADFQGIYQPDWASILRAQDDNSDLIASIDVGEVISEQAAGYRWENTPPILSFPSEVFELDRAECTSCPLIESVRRINLAEEFQIDLRGHDLKNGIILITRLLPQSAGTLDIDVNDEFLATRIIPQMPGRWLDVPTWIPAHRLTAITEIRIHPKISDGAYLAASHRVVPAGKAASSPIATTALFQDGAFSLTAFAYEKIGDQLQVDLDWFTEGQAQGDYRLFVHLYDDLFQPPVAQVDTYPQRGTLPPGNWLPGPLHDTIVLNLGEVQSGIYRLAIGFYDPSSNLRLMPVSASLEIAEDGRLFLGEVEINDGG